jgi:hypothetical protein
MPNRDEQESDEHITRCEEWIEGHLGRRALVFEEQELSPTSHHAKAMPDLSKRHERQQRSRSTPGQPTADGAKAPHSEHPQAKPEDRGQQHEVREVAEDADLSGHVPEDGELDEEACRPRHGDPLRAEHEHRW